MQNYRRGPNFQITRVWAKNFRSIADVSFEMDSLTVLVGPNASGKSNLLDILRFIRDALRFDLEVAIAFRNGMEGVMRHEVEDGDLEVEVGIAAVVRNHRSESGYNSVEYGFTITSLGNGRYKVSSEYGKVRIGDDSVVVEFRIEDGSLKAPEFLLHKVSRQASFSDDDSDFDTNNLAFPTIFRMSRPFIALDEERGAHEESLYRGLSELHRNLTGMRFYHIFPNTLREPQRLSNTPILEEDATNLASIIREMDRGSQGAALMERLREWLRLLIPGVSDLRVELVGGYLVVRLKHDAIPGGPWLDLSMESDGTVRLLGLLVALYQRQSLPRRLPVVGIEEPELTVHPGALAVLADVLNEAARRTQVIVTTHSPDFIDYLTNYRTVENLRIVELDGGVTTVRQVADNQAEAVKKHLFSPGELHRMGELTVSR